MGHLDSCPACEQTVADLDRIADSMLVDIRRRLPWLPDDSTSLEGPTPVPSSPLFDLDATLPEQLDDIRIIREIGRGGMGIVYEAYQGSLNRQVALKLLPARGDLARFKREAKAAGRLHHTNIVPVFGVGEYRGRHFYLMQYIAGRGLDAILKERRASAATGEPTHFDYAETARIGIQAAEAIAFAHEQGVIHRDVKPSNLLVDERGSVWITDFGLAQDNSDTETLTHSGDLLGTLRYMAPERITGRTSARADIYGLGISLYELISGRAAFPEADRAELLNRVLHHDPPRPRSLNPGVPRDLETIVLRAMARDEAHRYPSAHLLAEDLRRYLDGRSLWARPAGPLERASRWCRANPLVAGSLATACSIFLIAFALVSWSYWRAESAFQEEAKQRTEAVTARNEAQRREKAERWERYRSNIATASAALELQNSISARGALEVAPSEHHNWEWRHFHNRLDGSRQVWTVPGGSLYQLVMSPTGRHVTVSCFDKGDLYPFDLETSKPGTMLPGRSKDLRIAAYRPDGKQIAAGGSDGIIEIWNLETSQKTAHIQTAGFIALLSYSPDGGTLASLAENPVPGGLVQLWNSTTGEPINAGVEWHGDPTILPNAFEFSPVDKILAVACEESIQFRDWTAGRLISKLGPNVGPVQALGYSGDGKRILAVTRGSNPTITLWNSGTGEQLASLRGHTRAIRKAFFSSDSRFVISAGDHPEDKARIWDATTGQLRAVLSGHTNLIWSIAVSADGTRLATGSGDQTTRLWDVSTGRLIAVLAGHLGPVLHVLFNPDSSRLVTASADATLRLWDARTGEFISVLRGHRDRIFCMPVFTLDGSQLISGSTDGTMRVWDMNLVERTGIMKGHQGFVYDVAFSPDGKQLASSAWDHTTRVWETKTGRQLGLLNHGNSNANDGSGFMTSVSYSRDGRLLATSGREHGVTIWDVASQQVERAWHVPGGYWRADTRAALNPAGTLVAAGCAEGPVRLWDVRTGQELAQLKGHTKCSTDVSFDPDGRVLASAGEDGTIQIWDVANRQNLAVLRGHTGIVSRAVFSNDGKLLASGSIDKTVRLWDPRTWVETAVIVIGSNVYGLQFSPDDTRLAVACLDNTIRLIDVATRQEVAALYGHKDYVHAVAWSPDGTRLASASGDRTIRFWDSLSAPERATANANSNENASLLGISKKPRQ